MYFQSGLSLFSGVPVFDLVEIITSLGIIAILLVVFAESGLLVGFFLPGDSLLFTAGVLVQTKVLDINIHLFAMLLIIVAIMGYNTGYYFGRKVGPRLFSRPDSKLFKQENIKKTQEFFEKHGAQTIILTRFMPIVRTFAPIVAGVGRVNYRLFLIYNAIGAIIWAGGLVYAGYFLGVVVKSFGIDIDTILLPIIALILIASMLPAIVHFIRNKQTRDAIVNLAKKQLNQMFKKS